MSSKDHFEASKRLDEMAKEAGIQIQRYQNPLDMSKTRVTTNPAEIAKMSKPPDQRMVQEVDLMPGAVEYGDDNDMTAPSKGFKGLLKSTAISPEHQLPTNLSTKTQQPIPTTKTQSKSTPQQPQPTKPLQSALKPTPAVKNYVDLPPQQRRVRDSDYSVDERNEKAAGFFEIIETKLVPELTHYQNKREATARTLHDLEQLMDTIKGLAMAQKAGQKTTECKVNLGCKVLAEAKFVNTGKIIVDMGLGIFTELPYPEALQLLKTRCAHLQYQLGDYEKQCCLFSSRIKGMHEAIGVLTEITEGPEERAPLRDVWAQ